MVKRLPPEHSSITMISFWVLSCRNDFIRSYAEKEPAFKNVILLKFSQHYLCSVDQFQCYLTIIPCARMGSESIAAEWAIDSEAIRGRGISKIQLVGQEYRDKTTLANKKRFSRHCFGFQRRRFSLLAGYNIQPSSSSTNQNTALIIDHQLDFTNQQQPTQLSVSTHSSPRKLSVHVIQQSYACSAKK